MLAGMKRAWDLTTQCSVDGGTVWHSTAAGVKWGLAMQLSKEVGQVLHASQQKKKGLVARHAPCRMGWQGKGRGLIPQCTQCGAVWRGKEWDIALGEERMSLGSWGADVAILGLGGRCGHLDGPFQCGGESLRGSCDLTLWFLCISPSPLHMANMHLLAPRKQPYCLSVLL